MMVPNISKDQKLSDFKRFNNLDILRLLAALGVIVHHIEQSKSLVGMSNQWQNLVIHELGPLSVQFFFVLSGFLITNILLREARTNCAINLLNFYYRRIVRIWPLYYFTLFIAFVIFPNFILFPNGLLSQFQHDLHKNLWQVAGLYVFFLPNVALQFYSPVLGAAQCWSLGVEEQFYIIWPLLFQKFFRHPLKLFLGVVLVKLLLIKVAQLSGFLPATSFLTEFAIEAMACGGVVSYILSGQRIFKRLSTGGFCLLSSLALMIFAGYKIASVSALFTFSVLIYVAATSKPWAGKLYGILSSLGKLSYGIYMLHPLALCSILNLMLYMNLQNHRFANEFLYSVTIGLSLLLAKLSFTFVEQPFLKLKNRRGNQSDSVSSSVPST